VFHFQAPARRSKVSVLYHDWFLKCKQINKKIGNGASLFCGSSFQPRKSRLKTTPTASLDRNFSRVPGFAGLKIWLPDKNPSGMTNAENNQQDVKD